MNNKRFWVEYLLGLSRGDNLDIQQEGAPIVGYLNYLEDRMRIMLLHKKGMDKCFNRYRKQLNPLKRHLGMYECEIPIITRTIERLKEQSEKCSNTKFPEKCEQFYLQLIPRLESKIKFNNAQIDTLKRKMGLTKYD